MLFSETAVYESGWCCSLDPYCIAITLSPICRVFLSPASFIHYQLIRQHLSEKWHASNQTSFTVTSSSHLEGFMDAGLCQCSGCEGSETNSLEVYPQCHGQSCQHKWPWLMAPHLWRKRRRLQCSLAPAWVLTLLRYSIHQWFILWQKE